MPRSTPLRLAVVLALLAASCGSDEGRRGLTPGEEVTTPESEMELVLPEKQREQQNLEQEQRTEEREFDASEGGGMAP